MDETSSVRGFGLTELIVLLFGVFILAAILFPFFAPRGRGSYLTACHSNVKWLVLGTQMYADDNDERMPLAANWMDVSLPYVKDKKHFQDPQVALAGGASGYAYRQLAAGKSFNSFRSPDRFILTFDSNDTRWNASGGLGFLPKPGRHGGNNFVGFADGHSAMLDDQSTLFPALRADKSAGPE